MGDKTSLGLDFRALPKLELHAHLSGSISRKCLHEVWEQKREREGVAAVTLRDPLEEMPEGKFDYDLETFFPLFSSYIYALISDASSIRHSTLSVLQDFAADGVIYLELRTTPRAIPSASLTPDDYVSLVLSTIAAYESSFAPHPPKMKTRLLLSIDRSHTPAQALDIVNLAIKYQSPDQGLSLGVVGVDLCGNPAKGVETITSGAFAPAFNLATQHGLPLTLHFAESPLSATPAELSTLLSYAPSRLGHVVHVPPIPSNPLYTTISSLKIPLEILLSCNVSAKMLPLPAREHGYAQHHFRDWWEKTECPLVLGTDDVGVFGAPLSREYELAVEHFGLDKEEVLRLARGAVEAAFLGEEAKRELRARMW